MTRMIEYDDYLFFINERIKLLERGAALEIDPEVFGSQFENDMGIISRSLLQIRSQIDDSVHTLQRPENLRSLMLSNQKARVLAELLTSRGYLDAGAGASLEELHSAQTTSLEELLTVTSESPGDAEQVSPEEFEFLLKEEEDHPI